MTTTFYGNQMNQTTLSYTCDSHLKTEPTQHLTHYSETGTHSEIQAAIIHPYLYVCDEAA